MMMWPSEISRRISEARGGRLSVLGDAGATFSAAQVKAALLGAARG